MITEKTKAIAKARIRQSVPLDDIASELEIPLKLIEEWANNLSEKDMIMQEATVLAVDKIQNQVAKGELVPLNEDILKNILEETAIDITKSMAIPALNGDMVHAKAIQLLADSIVKMYQVLILKNGLLAKAPGVNTTSTSFLDNFSEMMKD